MSASPAPGVPSSDTSPATRSARSAPQASLPGGHGAQGEPATVVGAHETPARVPSAVAKRGLIDAYEARGWDPLQAKAKAIQAWGVRANEPIDPDDFSELIGEALNQEGPFDDNYRSPAE